MMYGSLTLFFTLLAASPVPIAGPPGQADVAEEVIVGELVFVDLKTERIRVRDAAGVEHVTQFSARTEVMVGEHAGLFQDLRAGAGSQAVVRGTRRPGLLFATQIHFVPASDFALASGVLIKVDRTSRMFDLVGNDSITTFRWAEPVVVQKIEGYGDWSALRDLVGRSVTVRYTEYQSRKTAHGVLLKNE